MASTVGTAGTAVGIPVTGAPRTSCSNLRERDRYPMSDPHQDRGAGHFATAPSSRPKPPRASLHAPSPSDPTATNGAASGLRRPGGSRFEWICPETAFISPAQGLTGPSPPPFLSSVPRRSCPGGRRQAPGPQGLPQPGVPEPAPPLPSLMPSPSPLLCRRRRRFYGRAPGSSGWEPAADVWTSATDALRDAVGPATEANEMWPHPQEEHKPIRVPEEPGPVGPCICQSAAERAGHALKDEGGE